MFLSHSGIDKRMDTVSLLGTFIIFEGEVASSTACAACSIFRILSCLLGTICVVFCNAVKQKIDTLVVGVVEALSEGPRINAWHRQSLEDDL